MIDLSCIKCQHPMQVDDAFAGSACRCQKCGTIQTVPGRTRAAQPTGAGTIKTLYTHHARANTPGSGLDALADVVASSGLGSGLRDATSGAGKPSTKRLPVLAIIAGGAGGIVAAVVATFILSRPNSATTGTNGPTSGVNQTNRAQSSATARSANFCGVTLNEPVVVYVLDRGNSTRDAMGYLVAATVQSIRSLGADRKFQVIFWDNGQSEAAYPGGGPQYATPETINAAQRVLEGVVAFGRTDAEPAIKKALAVKPGAIVLVTAKGAELDDAFNQTMTHLQKSAGGTTKIHTIAIGQPGEALAKIALATGGEHKSLTPGELRDAGQ